eukprot:CAMPEP_0202893792 /NCGR_PEP_ID=MMETSP1392-20130828/3298_1 /ASSEMBLY_ACC=CAM_ASM_000868 /TAXON_ID=225041 /ORGANISM="Chlamydomonas chlamydogama, Strain SAG 11-48b" /LENGTH=108 /DNA_ID=CAMNT_0049578245 /DNA_START=61 /DNA_END=387 /DNA_ORIENTATION=+
MTQTGDDGFLPQASKRGPQTPCMACMAHRPAYTYFNMPPNMQTKGGVQVDEATGAGEVLIFRQHSISYACHFLGLPPESWEACGLWPPTSTNTKHATQGGEGEDGATK